MPKREKRERVAWQFCNASHPECIQPWDCYCTYGCDSCRFTHRCHQCGTLLVAPKKKESRRA